MKKEPSISNKNKQTKLIQFLQKNFPNLIIEKEDGSFVLKKEQLQRFLEPKNWGKFNDKAKQKKATTEEALELLWVGKKEACQQAYANQSQILKPLKKESKNFAKTKNILIKGDNLSALKLLQNNYFEKIRIIYIDPPYNTKNDSFIYRSKFNESQEKVLEELGYSKAEKKYVKNIAGAKTHSGWLNFIYPRLLLARDLLTEDGVIFISIDDNEQANLKLLCDEIFGENNFINQFIWNTKKAAQGMITKNMVVGNHEYILVYAKQAEKFSFLGLERDTKSFSNPDNDSRGLWKRQHLQRIGQGLPLRTVVDPKTKRRWTFETPYTLEKINKWIAEERIIFPNNKTGYPNRKEFFNEYKTQQQLVTSLGLFATKSTTEKLYQLFDGVKIFTNPKPDNLLKYILQATSHKDDLILDFFAGSGTTADAIMQLNTEDGGNRKYILVQQAEEIDAKKNPEVHNFIKTKLKKKPTIFEICAERIRRAGTQLEKDNSKLDNGFKVFELVEDEKNEIYSKELVTLQKNEIQTLKVADNNFGLDNETLLYNLILGEGLELTEKTDCLIENCLFKVANRLFILREFDLNENSNLLKDKTIDFVCVYYKNISSDNFIRNLENYFAKEKIKAKV